MRVLITTSPGLGHMFPTVGLAWALRAAGHDVLLATAGRAAGDIAAAVNAGLPVAEIATVEQITAARQELAASRRREAQRRGITDEEMMRINVDAARDAVAVTDGNGWAFAARIFGPLSAATLDGLVGVARAFKPDLVVYELLQGGGPLVAALLGVPAVEHPVGLPRGPQVMWALAESLADEYTRYGVAAPAAVSAALDVSPPSLAIGPGYGWPMRLLPYNGGGVVDGHLRATRAGRPRIGVSISSSLAGPVGIGSLAPILAAAPDVDAEFVVTLGGLDPADLGELPGNVTAHTYLPLSILLPGCAAFIHHGGAGSTFAALDAGVPQLVLPYLGDSFINGAAVTRRGCGLIAESGAPDAGMISALLTEAAAAAAGEVAAELAALPAPAQLVPRLAALVA